jgi:Protein tyrosine and serine/threonine kinase
MSLSLSLSCSLLLPLLSFGIVLWEALVQEQAFAGLSDNLPSFIHAVMDLNERPKIPKSCPRSLRNLITDCWSPSPTDRPVFGQIVDRLDKCLVDIAIRDEAARRLWKKKKFLGKLEIPLRSFLKQLARGLERDFAPDTTPFKCVEAIVGKDLFFS